MTTPVPYSGRRFKSALTHYVLGRGLNALLALSLVVVLARTLSVADYGTYVTLWALLELALWLGNLGTDWITSFEIPRLRQAQQGRVLRRFLAQVLGAQGLAFGLLAAAWWWGGAAIAGLLGLNLVPEVQLFAITLLVEGISRSIRDQMLTGLLLQWVAQAGQAIRNVSVLLFAMYSAHHREGLLLRDLVWSEVIAASCAAILTGLYLLLVLRRLPQLGERLTVDWPEQRKRAFSGWVAGVSATILSGQAALMLIGRQLGVEMVATVGFARSIAEQVKRLMPVEFGFMIMRTFLGARFQTERNSERLVRRTQIIWMGNALLLLALLLATAVAGDALGNWVSGGKYPQAGLAIFIWLVWVFACSQRRLVDILAHLLNASTATLQTGLLLTPLALFMGLAAGSSFPLLCVLVLAVVEILYAWNVKRLTRGQVSTWPTHTDRLTRLALGTIPAAALTALYLGLPGVQFALWQILGLVLLVFLGMQLAARALRPSDFSMFKD